MSRSRRKSRPDVGAISPASRLKSVVFPAPFGPMIACSVPSCTSRSTLSTATVPPKRLVSLRALSKISPPADEPEQLDEPAAQPEHDRAEDHAEHERPVRPHVAELIGEYGVDRRPEDRAVRRADAAEYSHDHDIRRRAEAHDLERHET